MSTRQKTQVTFTTLGTGVVVSLLWLFACAKVDPTASSLTGVVSAGYVAGGTVTAYSLTPSGERSTALGATVTAADGSYALGFPIPAGPIEIAVTGGNYVEEATGVTVSLGSTVLRVRAASLTRGASLALTPLTEIATTRAQALVDNGGTLDTAITQANAEVAATAGLPDITTPPENPSTAPADPSSAAARYALVLAGLSRLANNRGLTDSLQLTRGLANDFKDGNFNGTDGGAAVTYPGTSVAVSGNEWNVGLTGAIHDYQTSAQGTQFASVTVPTITNSAGATPTPTPTPVPTPTPTPAPTDCTASDAPSLTACLAVFVSTTGDDSAAGDQAHPRMTIAAGISRAVALNVHHIYVDKGTYSGFVVLTQGVSLFGQFDATAGWTRNASNTTTILSTTESSGRLVAMAGSGITTPTKIDGFAIRTGAASSGGVSNYALYCSSCAGLILSNNSIISGNAVAGVAGSPGSAGTNGGTANNGPQIAHGGSGSTFGCSNGGNGGDPGCLTCFVPPSGTGTANGASGTAGAAGAAGGAGGTGQDSVGSDGTNGTGGVPGSNGSVGGTAAGSVVAGFWLGGDGSAGTDGTNGTGGGGGGGNGTLLNDAGNGGGGGGGGGCKGTAGAGGHAGGGSFGVFLVSSDGATLLGNSITSGNAGAGGAGGDGGNGGTAGMGVKLLTSTPPFGGKGGNGGAGGKGGGGAGGRGGISYALYLSGTTTITNTGNTLGHGSGGAGGNGGAGNTSGPSGSAGAGGNSFP